MRDEPLSRLCLSNTALWQTFSNLLELSDRVILTGGGGYNPWAVARLWTGFWAIMSGRQVPCELDASASSILRDLHWARKSEPGESVFQYFHDLPNKGIIRPEIQDLSEHLKRVHFL